MRRLLPFLLAAGCESAPAPPPAGDDAGGGGGGLVVRIVLDGETDESVEVDWLSLSIAEIEVESDVGLDDRTRDRTWRLLQPLRDGADRIAFDDAPPGTYSRLRIRLDTPPEGSALPPEHTPIDATAVVRGTLEGVPVYAASRDAVEWDLRCETGVELAPGGAAELVAMIDAEGWFEGDGIDDEELTDAAHLSCAEGGADADTDSDGDRDDAGPGDADDGGA